MRALGLILAVLCALPCLAGGPRSVNGEDPPEPMVWNTAGPVDYHPDRASPPPVRMVHRDEDVEVESAPPCLKLVGIQEILGRSRTVHHGDVLERLPLGEHGENRRAERRDPDAAGDDDDVATPRPVDRPGRTERPAHADDVARARCGQRVGDGPDGTNRLRDDVGSPGVAADRDRHLADSKRVEHRELTGLEGPAGLWRLELEGDGVRKLAHDVADPARVRSHGGPRSVSEERSRHRATGS